MSQQVDLSEIVRQAKERGYFDSTDCSGLTLSFEQVKKLKSLLDKKKIPWGSINSAIDLNRREAITIINFLRKGTPPSVDVATFSVGRKNLIDRFERDLQAIKQASSRIRFMNADYGHGKTHVLYLLREFAFRQGFVVSIVTLSQESCPIHDFISVYHRIMWNLRTKEERNKPAIENVLDRWLNAIRQGGEGEARRIISTLPDDMKNALHAYHESTSPVKPDEEKRVLVLKYLSAENVHLRDLRKIDIQNRIDSSNALSMLGYMASLFRNLNYRGICILFDEADPIHSFARWEHQDQAYGNLFQIIQQSQNTPHCFFLYATTPSFFDDYSSYWPSHRVKENDILELERLDATELARLFSSVCKIYSIAYNFEIPKDVKQITKKIAEDSASERIGDFIRKCIAILDEKKENG